MDRHTSTGKRGVVKHAVNDLLNKESQGLLPYQQKLLFDTGLNGRGYTGSMLLARLIKERRLKPTPDNQRLAKEAFEERPNNNIRGKRADLIYFDCAYICPHVDKCKSGKICPYDDKSESEEECQYDNED